ncbi:hypothetical protein QVD17_09277 [Tagetes erecta]|uniref:Uncharacterized protein n=1 Tax=Tagetes erecta TaxID=13708 RepID=A0AAD8L4C1_TARER|nr:hypothetical protein QVD17_09277 [Tagetes erecta]
MGSPNSSLISAHYVDKTQTVFRGRNENISEANQFQFQFQFNSGLKIFIYVTSSRCSSSSLSRSNYSLNNSLYLGSEVGCGEEEHCDSFILS